MTIFFPVRDKTGGVELENEGINWFPCGKIELSSMRMFVEYLPTFFIV